MSSLVWINPQFPNKNGTVIQLIDFTPEQSNSFCPGEYDVLCGGVLCIAIRVLLSGKGVRCEKSGSVVVYLSFYGSVDKMKIAWGDGLSL